MFYGQVNVLSIQSFFNWNIIYKYETDEIPELIKLKEIPNKLDQSNDVFTFENDLDNISDNDLDNDLDLNNGLDLNIDEKLNNDLDNGLI